MEITNNGMYQRQKAWNFNTLGLTGASSANSGLFSTLLTSTSATLVYKSSVTPPVSGTASVRGYWQAQIVGTVLLRHLHSFFDKMPLCKGVFMKITMNLNNTVVSNSVVGTTGSVATSQSQTLANCSFPMGGINPIMFASGATSNGMANVIPTATTTVLFASIYVGSKCYETNAVAANAPSGYVNNLTLNVPSYVFNTIYEQAYLSNPVRKIDYSDIYQYQSLGIKAGNTFNQLVTNGIAGIKSVLVLPFHSAVAAVNNTISPLQSCFDPAGGGTTSPLTLLNNFNVVISGQNAIYNSERYSYEQFLNQLIGQNGVNGNQLDGVSSGLVSQFDFENSYNYYFVNVERCLPIEKGVSKSVSITGTNVNAVDLDLYIFVEYGVSIQLNLLTGGRV